jgi:hypothetical protein
VVGTAAEDRYHLAQKPNLQFKHHLPLKIVKLESPFKVTTNCKENASRQAPAWNFLIL